MPAALQQDWESLKERKGELSSEDLARIERIASSMEAVTARIDHTLDNAGNNIEKARAPTVSLVSDIVKETKVEAIDPVIVSVQETVAASIISPTRATIARVSPILPRIWSRR